MATVCFYAQFTANKIGVNSLTVTWDIDRVTRSDGTRSALVTGGANSVTIGRRGLYGYVLTGADITTYDYLATAITADTSVDAKEVPALWTLWSISWYDIATSIMSTVGSIGKLFVDNITASILAVKSKTDLLPADPASDTQVNTRLAASSYTAPDNASITSIKTKTDNLPTDPADESLLEAAILAIPAAPSVLDIDTQLSSTHGAGTWVPTGAGTGSTVYVYNVTDSTTLLPLPDVTVIVFSNSALTLLIADGVTDEFGNVTFYLDPGTYYFVSKKAGYSFTNPDIEVVS